RGHPDVHHDPVDRGRSLRCADFVKLREATLDQCQPAPRPLDQTEAAGNRSAVAVDADDPGSLALQDRPAVAARAESGIEVDAAAFGGQPLDGLAAQHGNMARASRTHAPPPGNGPRKAGILDVNGPIAPQMSALRRTFRRQTRLRVKRPWRGAIADPARPRPRTLFSARNCKGCHGISSVNRFGTSLLSNGSQR